MLLLRQRTLRIHPLRLLLINLLNRDHLEEPTFPGRAPPYHLQALPPQPGARGLWERLCHHVPTNSWPGAECCRPNKFGRPPLPSRRLQTTETEHPTLAERLAERNVELDSRLQTIEVLEPALVFRQTNKVLGCWPLGCQLLDFPLVAVLRHHVRHLQH